PAPPALGPEPDHEPQRRPRLLRAGRRTTGPGPRRSHPGVPPRPAARSSARLLRPTAPTLMLTQERVAATTPAPAAPPSDRGQPRPGTRAAVVFPLLGALLLVVFVLGIAVGSVPIPVVDVVKVLTGHESHGVYYAIVHDIRLPRSITGVLVGAALGVAGLQLQT